MHTRNVGDIAAKVLRDRNGLRQLDLKITASPLRCCTGVNNNLSNSKSFVLHCFYIGFYEVARKLSTQLGVDRHVVNPHSLGPKSITLCSGVGNVNGPR